MRKIILASSSPQRKNILKLLNLNFIIENSNIDESIIKSNNKNPKQYCKKLAIEKAKFISQKRPSSLVIGADTIVYHDNKILEKPKNKKEAIKHLKLLNNNSHIVFTAVSIQINELKLNKTIIDKTIVTFNKISLNDIKYYVNNFNPCERAGAYGIQDWSSIFVKKINGCYYNVVGFPLPKFYILLNQIQNKL